MRTTFKDLKDFYRVRGGCTSGETDYGVFNYQDEDAERPPTMRPCWKVSHVHETGDLYALAYRLDHEGDRVVLLGRLADTELNRQAGTYLNESWKREALGRIEAIFEGWADPEGPAGRPLSWFSDRIDAFNASLESEGHE